MVFPKSNLSTSAQPWGRFVEKSITNLEALVATEKVNNAARDAQSALGIKRLDASLSQVAQLGVQTAQNVADILTITNNVFTAGTTEINGYNIKAGTVTATQISSSYVYAGTINASQITAGSISGDRISGGTIVGTYYKSANSGQRVEINGTQLVFYDTSGVSVIASATSSAFGLSGFGGSLNFNNSGMHILGSGGSTSIWLGDYSSSNTINMLASTISASGLLYSSTGVSTSGNLSADGSIIRTALINGGSTTATINNSGQFVRTTSSARYKQDITNLVIPLEKILAMEPKTFRLKEEAIEDSSARYYAGFIAEELDALGLNVFVGYQKLEDGTSRPESIYYAELTAALVSAIKELNSRIEQLEGK